MNDYKNREKFDKKESRLLSVLIYTIIIVTVIMLAPLVYKFAGDFSAGRSSAPGGGEDAGETPAKNRKYTVAENTIDISGLRNTEFGALGLITAKVTDGGDIILFCSRRVEINAEPEYEEIASIAAIKNIKPPGGGGNAEGELVVYNRAVRNNFLESIQNKDYVFKDYGDGTFFLSNNKAAFLFDTGGMRIAESYVYPQNFNVYQTVLSNNKEMIALAAEEGFFVAAPRESNMTLTPSSMKELIASVNAGGVTMTAREPFWSSDDGRIFYKLYADNFVRNAGVTTASPGGNEQLTALEAGNFIFLNSDTIFYYFSAGAAASTGSLFRCGYFNLTERRMREAMRSQAYYFAIDVSPDGRLLAALSHSGNSVKISVIDIPAKRLIYSSLYTDIYDFSFSPDGKNMIIYGRLENRQSLDVINIDWTEEE